jgi:hypothetical protein
MIAEATLVAEGVDIISLLPFAEPPKFNMTKSQAPICIEIQRRDWG